MFGPQDDSSSERSDERVVEDTSPARQSPSQGLFQQVRSLFGEQEALRTAYLGAESPRTRPRPVGLTSGEEVTASAVAAPEVSGEELPASPRDSPPPGTPTGALLGNTTPPPQRKSARLAKRPVIVLPSVRERNKQASPPRAHRPTLPMVVGPLERVDPQQMLEESWLRARPYPTKAWVLSIPGWDRLRYYCASGAAGSVTREELEGLRISTQAMARYRGSVTTLAKSVQRAVVRRFAEIGGAGALYPTDMEWRDYMRPESSQLWIEYLCRACGTSCKVFNKYGALIDEHERYGRTTCDLIGRRCGYGIMDIPAHLVEVYGQKGQAAQRQPAVPIASPPVTSVPTVPPPSLQQEERGTPLLGGGSYEHLAGEIFEDFPLSGGIAIRREAEDTGGSEERQAEIMEVQRSPATLPAPDGGPTPISAFAWSTGNGTTASPTDAGPVAQAEALNKELLRITQALADLSKRVGRSEGITTPQAVTEPQLTPVASGSSFSEQHLPSPNGMQPSPSTGPFPVLTGSHPASVGPVQAEEEWAEGLDMSSLQRLAKGTGRILSGRDYAGDPNPTLFAAWCNSIRTLVKVYNVTPGPSQVLAASSFLSGKAWDWWAGVQTSRRYLDMGGLEEFFHAVQF